MRFEFTKSEVREGLMLQDTPSFDGDVKKLDEGSITESADAVLSVRHLEIGFNAKKVIRDINLDMPRGHVVALIGPTGSGKTTFLRSVNRLNDKISGFWTKGSISLHGEELLSKDTDLLELRRKVGMLFQRPNPFPMSIKENVLAGVKAHRLAPKSQHDEIVRENLEKVGLWKAVQDRLNDSPFRLSGGQQQLLCLARSLAVQPEVLLLDEPTSALDPISVEAVEDLLRKLVPEITFIVVTHSLAQARRISDHTMFFYDGKLMESGETENIFNDPQMPETQYYISGRMG
ncbi:MAG: phosphate ABC transporter ATP-binding protein [Actinomycetota bacterium]|nr:phosphate ABC transporter ATP-binding protein [Actinomycetota bacterium]